jgi:uncharacterized protein (DUF58 family)
VVADNSEHQRIPSAFGATSILQFLGGIAALLAAYVLPLSFPEFQNHSSHILYVVGAILLLVGFLNVYYRRQLQRVFQYLGMRSRFLLPREGIVYLGIMLMLAIAALLGHSNMLLLVFGMMAGPFILNGWIVISMLRSVSVKRVLPQSVVAGELFSAEIVLRNDKVLLSSRLIEIRDSISGLDTQQEAVLTFVRVPPLSSRSGSYQLRISKRGRYRFGPIRISSRFPLGIGERGITTDSQSLLLVHPGIGRLYPGWLTQEQETSETTSRVPSRIGVFDDEFHRIREYRAGDHPRTVHWRSTAKRGELMVKEYDQRRDSDLTVLLDLPVLPGFTEEDVELAISLVATVCVDQTRNGGAGSYRLMVAGSENSDIRSVASTRFRESALDALAICQPAPSADLRRMLVQLAQSVSAGNERILLVTPRTAVADRMIRELEGQMDTHAAAVFSRITMINASSTDMLRIFVPSEAADILPAADLSDGTSMTRDGR